MVSLYSFYMPFLAIMPKNVIIPVLRTQQHGAIVSCHCFLQITCILHTGSLIAGVHCQLSKANIRRRYRHMAQGQLAEGTAAQQVRAIIVVLHRYFRLGANLAENCRRDTVSVP